MVATTTTTMMITIGTTMIVSIAMIVGTIPMTMPSVKWACTVLMNTNRPI